MFRRKPAADPPPAPTTTTRRGRFVTVTTVQALPDTATIGRLDTLQSTVAAGMQGRAAAGTTIGYDRGDPAHSLQRMIAARPSAVSEAIAAVYSYHNPPPQPELADALATNPRLDQYNSLLWSRFAR